MRPDAARSDTASRSRSKHDSGEQQRAGDSGKGGSDALKAREYRDGEGNIHHHTRTSQAMQDKK
jgi:hypothetical protein